VTRRQFGNVRRLPSGRWQANYYHQGKRYTGPNTFRTKADANAYLSTADTDLRRGGWIDPGAGKITFREFADGWLSARLDLRPTTRSLYRILLDTWLLPHVGDTSIGSMTPEFWTRWHTKMVAEGKPGSLQPAKAYKLAHTILNSAVGDRRIILNPCVVKGAATEASPERPTASIEQIFAIADAIEPEYRALVLVGAFASLRFGEAVGLRRRSVDLLYKTIVITDQAVELADGSTVFGPPKTAAGRRKVAIPDSVFTAIEYHLDIHVGPDPEALLFSASNGAPLRRTKFRSRWLRACTKAKVTGLHFHDLRGSGATLAATQGATIAELMNRLGHTSATAAMRYQHATAERDRSLADAMGKAIADAKPAPNAKVTAIR
jgi:integrase